MVQEKRNFHPYIKPPTSRKKKNRIAEWLSELYPLAKSDEVDLMIKLNDKADLKDLALENGMSDKEIKELF